MIQNKELNERLKIMWKIDESISNNNKPSKEEVEYYNSHLEEIKDYYSKNNQYWSLKINL